MVGWAIILHKEFVDYYDFYYDDLCAYSYVSGVYKQCGMELPHSKYLWYIVKNMTCNIGRMNKAKTLIHTKLYKLLRRIDKTRIIKAKTGAMELEHI